MARPTPIDPYFSTRNAMYKKLELLTNMKYSRLGLANFDRHGGHIIPTDLREGPKIVHTYFENGWGGGTEITRKPLFKNTKVCFYCLILNTNKLAYYIVKTYYFMYDNLHY